MNARRSILVFSHVLREHLGTFDLLIKRSGGSLRVLETPSHRGRWPTPKSADALIIMGGPMGVYEEGRHPFINKEIAAIARFIDAGKPVLGVCLGAQLIAAALGARVYPNKRKEIGWNPIHLTPEGMKDPLFAGFKKRETVFQWHGDTFDLPAGAVRLAGSPLCRNQAFRWGDRVYGLQFHIEVSHAMIRDWLAQPGAEAEVASVGPGALRRLKTDLPARTKSVARLAKNFIDKFWELR